MLSRLIFGGENLSKYQADPTPFIQHDKPPSQGHHEAEAFMIERQKTNGNAMDGNQSPEFLEQSRKDTDALGLDRDFPDCAFTDVSFTAKEGHEITGEWVATANSNPNIRTLYIHGGAFVTGSCYSHRAITTEMAKRSGGVVYAVNYRLLPEVTRLECIVDSKQAYDWLVDTQPILSGAGDVTDTTSSKAEKLFVAGDSAGGNLALVILNERKAAGQSMPDAVICFSPATDGTMSGKSVKGNVGTDTMLAPLISPYLKVPHTFLQMGLKKANHGVSPRDVRLSPIHADDLSGFPPILIQASNHEMLRDDAVRYAHKAKEHGVDVTLQLWNHVCHVWQIFQDENFTEANEALDEVGTFMRRFT